MGEGRLSPAGKSEEELSICVVVLRFGMPVGLKRLARTEEGWGSVRVGRVPIDSDF